MRSLATGDVGAEAGGVVETDGVGAGAGVVEVEVEAGAGVGVFSGLLAVGFMAGGFVG